MDVQRGGEPDRRLVPRGGRRPSDKFGRYPSVLVADSLASARQSCVRYLQRLNFEVVEARSREELAARLVTSPPCLILAESTLPGAAVTSDWLDVLRAHDIPVFAIANRPEDVPGVAGVLPTMFALNEMIAEVRRVLRETDRFSTAQQEPSHSQER